MIRVEPVVLEGHGVRLEPLSLDHVEGLRAAAADGELWNLVVTSVPEPDDTRGYVERAFATQDRVAFAVRDAVSGAVLGSTSYHDILPAVDRLEVGYTWYAKSRQKTRVNPACKLLLMRHAFETLGAQVVGWRTDGRNLASQRAIERLGARKDGVVRHQALRRDGSVRDTVLYSMILAEWPAARAALEARLG